MDETSGQGRATLVRDEVEFDDRDVTLLREIDETGSVAKASTNLGRSRARDLSRIGELESAFGDLVERRRGGSGGGGSELTDTARRLLNQYERLQVALTATAQVPETVLEGTVSSVSGELADVATSVGTVRGLHDGGSRDDASKSATMPFRSGSEPTRLPFSIRRPIRIRTRRARETSSPGRSPGSSGVRRCLPCVSTSMARSFERW